MSFVRSLTRTTPVDADPTAPAALVVEGLTVHYGGVRAVHDVALTVPPGQALGVIGANGAGKTSTLKAVLGLVPRKVTTLRLGSGTCPRCGADMVRHGIGYVPQGRHVFSGLSVEKNLMLGANAQHWGEQINSTRSLGDARSVPR